MESRNSKTIILKAIAAGGFFLLLFFLFRSPHHAPQAPSPVIPPVPQFFTDNLRHGDLLFREGRTFASEVARKASLRDQRFSHVGIVERQKDEIFVIHAISDETKGLEGLVREKLSSFLVDGKSFGAFRMKLEEARVKEIVQKAKGFFEKKIPYDHDYDLAESEKFYCTEFVFHLFQGLPETVRIGTSDFLGKKIIAIENIYEDEDFFEAVF